MSKTDVEARIIEVLQKGPVRDRGGMATQRLMDRIVDCPVGLAGLRLAVSRMADRGVVTRDVRGRRTFAIQLMTALSVVEDDGPDDDDDGVPMPVAAGVDVDALAVSLLAEVMEKWNRPYAFAEQAERLAGLLEDNRVLRTKLGQKDDELARQGDRVRALVNEVRGLRQRVTTAEANAQAALAKNGRVIDMEVRKHVDRFMREAPGASR